MIHVKKQLVNPVVPEDGSFIQIILTDDSKEHFTTAMNRALNCWPDAPPELKELADMLNHGKILQDYYSQDTSKKDSK
jgi:hypothetical protein